MRRHPTTRRHATWAFGIIEAMSLMSCGPEETVTGGSGVTESRIIAGAVDDGDPAVMLLEKRTESGASLCTSSLIAPNVLLTAAHCVVPNPGDTPVELVVSEGQTPGNANIIARSNVAYYDRAYDPNNLPAGHDIAIVVLDHALTDITPLPLNRAPLAPDARGAAVRLVGYGVTDGYRRTGLGTKRQVSTQLNQYSNILLHVGDSAGGGCFGDSGGPSLMRVDGIEKIVGVTSYVLSESGCLQGIYHTRVDAYLDIIDTFLPPSEPSPSEPSPSEPPPSEPPPSEPPPSEPPPSEPPTFDPGPNEQPESPSPVTPPNDKPQAPPPTTRAPSRSMSETPNGGGQVETRPPPSALQAHGSSELRGSVSCTCLSNRPVLGSTPPIILLLIGILIAFRTRFR